MRRSQLLVRVVVFCFVALDISGMGVVLGLAIGLAIGAIDAGIGTKTAKKPVVQDETSLP